MIVSDETQYPNNVVSLLAVRADLLDADLYVTKRSLRSTDPNQAVGIYAANWSPDEESKEMRGAAFAVQPTTSQYRIVVQGFIRDTDEERGLNVHSVLSRMLRSMLYTDNPLRVALGNLTASLAGQTESTKRWGVSQQRFFVNELPGEWLYLSILEFWLETEIR